VRDINFPRWVRSSIGVHFQTFATVRSLPMLISGIDDPDENQFSAQNRVELRIHGPSLREWDNDNYTGFVNVNLLFTEIIGQQNAYAVVDDVGAFQYHAYQNINIKRYGTNVGDDESLIGCLEVQRKPIELYDFGRLSDKDGVRQLMLDVLYYIDTTLRG
jgi:hypothetical protein